MLDGSQFSNRDRTWERGSQMGGLRLRGNRHEHRLPGIRFRVVRLLRGVVEPHRHGDPAAYHTTATTSPAPAEPGRRLVGQRVHSGAVDGNGETPDGRSDGRDAAAATGRGPSGGGQGPAAPADTSAPAAAAAAVEAEAAVMLSGEVDDGGRRR